MTSEDTFCALATPAGESALAVVRASGPLCAPIAQNALGAPSPVPARRASFGRYRARDGDILDEVVWTFFEKNASYTGDFMLELSLHGNPLIARRVLEDLCARGCRLAAPGEFTRTAFLNGRIDLSRAEAVADVIHARTARALKAAQRGLSGALGKQINALMESLLEIIAHVEARIDFADEDLPEGDGDIPARRLADLLNAMRALARTRPYHTLLQEGARAVILGAPNAGKSTLLNTLLGEERALVSPEAGTTRDYIVEHRRVGDYCVQFIDTAGVRQNADGLEAAGIARTLEKLADSDCCLLVVDISTPPPDFPQAVQDALSPEKTLLIENKIDLPNRLDGNYLSHIKRRLRVSLKTGENVAALEGEIVRMLESGVAIPAEDAVAVNARQAAALDSAIAALETALSQHARGVPPEFVASDLHAALDALGEILGRVENERILDRIFSTFCIGK